MSDWTKNLKVGDKVIVTPNLGEKRISVVQGFTPKGFIRVDGMLFNQDGIQRTGGWYYSRIEEYTEEKCEKMRQETVIKNALSIMRNCSSSIIDYEKAVKILQILDTNEREDTE